MRASLRKVQASRRTFLGQRQLWTAKTVVTDEPHELLEALPSREAVSKSTAALFNISRNVPRATLGPLVKAFQDLSVPSVGCLSLGNDGEAGPYLLSYALHESPSNSMELVLPFKSTIRGTPKIALGREIGRIDQQTESTEWAGDAAVAPEALPEDLSNLDPSLISEIIYFSDEQPQGLMRTLDTHLPQATKVGLMASPTPFTTGRPHTMITNQEIHSTGAVGIAICRYPKPDSLSHRFRVDYGRLQPLGGPMEITSSSGNIILELASENATKVLLERIQENVGSKITKDLGFYAGILPDNRSEATLDQMLSVRPIIAGDPKRGALSLDTEANVSKGQRMQFFHTPGSPESLRFAPHPSQTLQAEPSIEVDHGRVAMTLRTEQDPDALRRVDQASTEGKHSLLAVSEHGFIVGQPGGQSWICQVDGSQGNLML